MIVEEEGSEHEEGGDDVDFEENHDEQLSFSTNDDVVAAADVEEVGTEVDEKV